MRHEELILKELQKQTDVMVNGAESEAVKPSVEKAEAAAQKAVDAANTANASQTAAKISEQNAVTAAQTATTKATAADASAKASKTSETNAAQSAEAAKEAVGQFRFKLNKMDSGLDIEIHTET